ncbi:molybdopterin molybdotransferase MoeA [Wohlfahrtiimonas larvae]|uniref:Molybdopterin molybdenumtransferase n=1 Tax=Wohlfahrtiimonas larvae TaxID=1157986 RepID=A0ABP9MDD7_9GAMM|nr:gephyrin-like molybdotransferase Glp [Wohlfahrtiimonas larvae]
MLDFHVALTQLSEAVQLPQKVRKVSLIESLGKHLSEDLFTVYDTPMFNNSAMDGYAVCDPDEDLTEFKVVGRIAAGDLAKIVLNKGESVRIFTGAPTPKGTTSVVMQEHIDREGDVIRLQRKPKNGMNIRYLGEEAKKGDLLLAKNREMTAATIALCASQGYSEIPVFDGLSIAVVSTGSELIPQSEPLSAGKIYDANRFMLQAWLKKNHYVHDAGIVKDNYEATKAQLLELSKTQDVIILSGGASVGEEDHVGRAIAEVGQLNGWKIAIKPGKPFGWGKIGNAYVFMLPGNPVSAYVTFYLFVYPFLQKSIGATNATFMKGTAKFKREKLEPRREFLRGMYVENLEGGFDLTIAKGQGSAMLSGLAVANCLIEILPNTTVEEGMALNFYPIQ